MNGLRVSGGATILKISPQGEGLSTMGEQAQPFLAQNPLLILDVGDLGFTSMDMGEVINLANSFKAIWEPRLHRIALMNLSPRAAKVFQAAKLDRLFEIYDSVSEALDQFHGKTA